MYACVTGQELGFYDGMELKRNYDMKTQMHTRADSYTHTHTHIYAHTNTHTPPAKLRSSRASGRGLRAPNPRKTRVITKSTSNSTAKTVFSSSCPCRTCGGTRVCEREREKEKERERVRESVCVCARAGVHKRVYEREHRFPPLPAPLQNVGRCSTSE